MRRIQESSILSDSCVAIYKPRDLSLDIAIHYPEIEEKSYEKVLSERIISRDKNETFMFIYGGTVTITFGGKSSLLKSIDAYTNHVNWNLQAVEIPPSVPSGLSLADGSCDTGDRFSIEFEPSYSFDSKKRVLRIALGHSQGEKLFSISDSLIIGVSEGLISSLVVKNLVVK